MYYFCCCRRRLPSLGHNKLALGCRFLCVLLFSAPFGRIRFFFRFVAHVCGNQLSSLDDIYFLVNGNINVTRIFFIAHKHGPIDRLGRLANLFLRFLSGVSFRLIRIPNRKSGGKMNIAHEIRSKLVLSPRSLNRFERTQIVTQNGIISNFVCIFGAGVRTVALCCIVYANDLSFTLNLLVTVRALYALRYDVSSSPLGKWFIKIKLLLMGMIKSTNKSLHLEFARVEWLHLLVRFWESFQCYRIKYLERVQH